MGAGLKRGIQKGLITAVLVIAAFFVYAQKEAYRQTLHGYLKQGDSLVATDDKYALMTSAEWSTLQNLKVKAGVTFLIRFDTLANMPQKPFKAEIVTDIYYWKTKGQTTPYKISNISLRVEYDTMARKTLQTSDVYEVDSAHKIAVVIREIHSEVFPDSLPAFFQLKNEIDVRRRYPFDPQALIQMNGVINNSDAEGGDMEAERVEQPLDLLPGCSPHPADLLTLSWQSTIGSMPTEYDLEYAFIDFNSEYGYMFRNTPSLVTNTVKDNIFRFNGTRVTLKEPQTNYRVNLAYETGYFIARIRGVSYYAPQPSNPDAIIRNEGDWSYTVTGTPLPVNGSWWYIGNDNDLPNPKPHESCINWQYNASFAEGGARKEIVTYFDGKLQNRQTVTINNHDDVAIVQETILDEFGRAAANILPAPADGSHFINNRFQYFRQFNTNNSGASYSYKDILYNNCSLAPAALSTAIGAAQYYSASNWFKTLTDNVTGNLTYPEANYTPDAAGFPLSVTQYTDDQSGRIRKQGGVGIGFQPGGVHDTRYFYGKPTQYELDRLFGSEAGDASHYLKNMVMDPNGQISVSYINSTGKTIATALAGTAPPNLDALSSLPNPTFVTNTIVKPSELKLDAGTNILLGTSTFLAPVTGNYNLTYNLDGLRYIVHYTPALSQQLCYTCYYDVEITVRNSCGATLLQSSGQPLDHYVHDAGLIFNTDCAASPAVINGTLQAVIGQQDIGECNVTYKLVISKKATDYYTDHHWQNNTDLKRFKDFLLQYFNEAAFKDCFTDCQTCEELESGQTHFVNELTPYIQKLIAEKHNDFIAMQQLDIQNYLGTLYTDLSAQCQVIKQSQQCIEDPCMLRLEKIMEDVTPGGQYALYDSTTWTLIEPNVNVLQHFTDRSPKMDPSVPLYTDQGGNQDHVYNDLGQLVQPEQLSLREFIQNFKPSWARTLAYWHPEYCYYQWCEMNESSRLFDEKIKDMDASYAFASANHYIVRGNPDALLDKDPFFNTVNGVSGYGVNYYAAMKWELDHYSKTKIFDATSTERNILEFIDFSLYCKDQNWNTACSINSTCRKDNREWEMYVGLYLQLKQKYDEMTRRCWQPACVNCYIGTDSITAMVNRAVTASCSVNYPSTDWTTLLPSCSFGSGSCSSAEGSVCYDAVGGTHCYNFHFCEPVLPGTSVEIVVEFCPGDPAYTNEQTAILTAGDGASVTICNGVDYSACDQISVTYHCISPGATPCMDATCESDPRHADYLNKSRVFPDYVDFCKLAQLSCPSITHDYIDNINAQVTEAVKSNCEAEADNLIQELKNRNCGAINSMSSTALAAFKTDLVTVCSSGLVGNPPNSSGVYQLQNPYGVSVSPVSYLTYHSFNEVIDHYLGSGTAASGCSSDLIGLPYPYTALNYVLVKPQIREGNSTICTQLTNLFNSYHAEHGVDPTDDQFYFYLWDLMGEDFDLTKSQLLELRNTCSSSCGYLLNDDMSLPAGLSKTSGCKTCAQVTTVETAFNTFYPALSTTDPQYEVLYKNFMNHQLGFTLTYTDYYAFKVKCQQNSGALLCDQSASFEVGIDEYSCVRDKIDDAFTLAQQAFWQYKDSVDNAFRIAYRTVCRNAPASLSLSSPFQEYHYTLYYYDQAGNLVKTVPPEGVRPLTDATVALIQHPWDNSNLGNCVQLNSPNSVTLSDATYLKSGFTISYRVKPSYFGGYSKLISVFSNRQIQDAGNNYKEKFELFYDPSLKQFTLQFHTIGADGMTYLYSSFLFTTASGLPLNNWSDLAIVRVPGAMNEFTLYINGTPYAGALSGSSNTTYSGSTLDLTATNYTLLQDGIGSSQMLCRELKIFTRSLPAIEIWSNAQQALQVYNNAALIHWLKMNDGAGNTTCLNSVNVVPASLTGSSLWSSDLIFTATTHRLITSYAYNSLNQVVKQNTPDGGTSEFWYDRLGRLVISQNAEQKTPSGTDASNRYSYTKYDALGRIIEVGEKTGANTGISEVNTRDNMWLFGQQYDYTTSACNTSIAANTTDPHNCGGWYNSGANRQITVTRYNGADNAQDFNTAIDLASTNIASIISLQQNLRNRVAATFYLDVQGASQQFASFYTYDISGNVSTLWQQIKPMQDYDNVGIKRMDYGYDLVSGKVNEVWYQQGKKDQYYYRYYYDIENRLTEAWSGRSDDEQTHLRLDANYRYYLHGPLARMELGHTVNKLQGLDYAYTLQGWLKGVNGSVLNPVKEMGRDGTSTASIHAQYGRDVFSYVLNYFGSDYQAINNTSGSNCFMSYTFSPGTSAVGKPLYNGNIAAISVALKKLKDGATTGYSYGYDQLNRLINMRKHIDGISDGSTTTTWGAGSVESDDRYKETYTYDGNGNIQTLLRNGANTSISPLAMDNLEYWYYYMDNSNTWQVYNKTHMPSESNVQYLTNRLAYVTDQVGQTNYTVDIDNEGANNYNYDKIGNMMADNAEGITSIKWTVYGKIQQISKTKNGVNTQMYYYYDVAGNRVMKKVNNKITFYVRDAQGNVMAVYDADNTDGYTWQEQDLYGSSRLGMFTPRDYIAKGSVNTTPPVGDDPSGKRTYELSNHLGNVMVTISDIKRQYTDLSGTYYLPEILSTSDYYPFGMLMPERSGYKTAGGWASGNEQVNGNTVVQTLTVDERHLNTPSEYKASQWVELTDGFESSSNDDFLAYIADGSNTPAGNPTGSGGENNSYRYGFNGKENDDEVKGVGDEQDYGMRIYDNRSGRFLSIDPLTKEYPWNSPYTFAEGDVMRSIDLDGLERLLITQVYDKYGRPTSRSIAGIRDKNTLLPIQMNMQTAQNRPLTNQDVYLLRQRNGRIFSEAPQGNLTAAQQREIAAANIDQGTTVNDLPPGNLQMDVATRRGVFSSSIKDIDHHDFFAASRAIPQPVPILGNNTMPYADYVGGEITSGSGSGTSSGVSTATAGVITADINSYIQDFKSKNNVNAAFVEGITITLNNNDNRSQWNKIAANLRATYNTRVTIVTDANLQQKETKAVPQARPSGTSAKISYDVSGVTNGNVPLASPGVR